MYFKEGESKLSSIDLMDGTRSEKNKIIIIIKAFCSKLVKSLGQMGVFSIAGGSQGGVRQAPARNSLHTAFPWSRKHTLVPSSLIPFQPMFRVCKKRFMLLSRALETCLPQLLCRGLQPNLAVYARSHSGLPCSAGTWQKGVLGSNDDTFTTQKFFLDGAIGQTISMFQI